MLSRLAAADMQRNLGNLGDAYLGYLGILNDYPEAWLQGAVDARDRIKDMSQTLSEAEFQSLNALAADWTTLHGPLAVRGTNEFYRAWAEACKERGGRVHRNGHFLDKETGWLTFNGRRFNNRFRLNAPSGRQSRY